MTLMNVMSMTIADGPASLRISLKINIVLDSHWNLHVLKFNISILNAACKRILHAHCKIHYQRILFGLKSSIIGVIKTRHAICFDT